MISGNFSQYTIFVSKTDLQMKETVIISCLAYLLALVVTGLVVARRNRKTSDFLVAGRSLNLPLTAISLAAVQIGVGIVLGSSSNGYEDGIWPGIYYALGCGLGLIFAGLVTARKLRSRESYVPLDFFAQRYGDSRGVRLWAAISNVPSLLGIFIAQMVAAGSILAGFGLPFSTGVLLCMAVVLIYCMMGGMWSVVFTDVVQVTVIMIAIPVFCAIAMVKYGQSGGDLIGIFSTPFIPEGMGTRFVYLVLPFLLSISVSYDAYIKIQSSKDSRTASRGACIAGLIVILVGTMCSVIGVVASKMFPGLTDGMFATAATGLLPPVLAGIVVAAILAAALSSASCILLSLGSSVSRDFYNRFLHPEVDQLDQLKNSKRVSQAAILVACAAGCVFALYITDILDAMIIFNYPYMGSMLIPLLGGLLWKGATRRGAFAAAIAGGCVGVVSFFIGIPGPLHGLMNTDLALLLAYAVSAVTLVTVSLMDNNKRKI